MKGGNIKQRKIIPTKSNKAIIIPNTFPKKDNSTWNNDLIRGKTTKKTNNITIIMPIT